MVVSNGKQEERLRTREMKRRLLCSKSVVANSLQGQSRGRGVSQGVKGVSKGVSWRVSWRVSKSDLKGEWGDADPARATRKEQRPSKQKRLPNGSLSHEEAANVARQKQQLRAVWREGPVVPLLVGGVVGVGDGCGCGCGGGVVDC